MSSASFTKSSLSVINNSPVVLFIPRLLPNISKQFICEYFKTNKIGIVTDINAKHRVNENHNKYWFAFVNVQFFDTSYGKNMYQNIVEKEKTEYMFYNELEDKYWEISVRLQDRKYKNKSSTKAKEKEIKEKEVKTEVKKEIKKEIKKEVELEEGEIIEDNRIMNTHFTIYDHVEMYHDYRELEKEIYGNNAFSWSSSSSPMPSWGTFIPLRI